MAYITTAQAGDWSDPNTWNGGVVPTSADTIRMIHDVNADVDISITAIDVNCTGALLVTSSRTIDISGSIQRPNWLFGINKGVIDITFTLGMEVTLNIGHIVGVVGTLQFSPRGIIINTKGSDGILTINALITGAGGTNLGNVYGGYVVYLQAANSMNYINGILRSEIGAFNSYFPPVFSAGGTKTINIDGILESGRSVVLTTLSTDTVIINGLSQSSAYQSVSVSTGTYILSGQIINAPLFAYRSPSILIGGDIDWQFDTPTIGQTTNLYTAGLLSGYPVEEDVEDGVVYGPSNEYEGTLSPVNVDTAQLASDLLDEIQTSPHVVAQRLRATSTDDSVGQIVASTLGNS